MTQQNNPRWAATRRGPRQEGRATNVYQEYSIPRTS
jgi:hypothetical protein